jgi:murein L,D-transpeptidase YcbB/YkuD
VHRQRFSSWTPRACRDALKEQLHAWYEKNSPGEWETLRISDNDVFRAVLDKAVRRFQAWAALTVDGEVGPQVCVRTRGYTNVDFIVP